MVIAVTALQNVNTTGFTGLSNNDEKPKTKKNKM